MDPSDIRSFLGRVRAVHLGVDLGQTVDYSAIAVVEVGERATGRMVADWRVDGDVAVARGILAPWQRSYGASHMVPEMESTYRVQRLVRIDLGNAWVTIAERVCEVVGWLWEWERGLREAGELAPHDPQLPWDIWADATGVGRPVMELIENGLRASTKTDRAILHPVVFNHGDRFTRGGYERYGDILGKAYLVSRLQSLAQAVPPLLRLPPRDPEADAMVQELKDYKIKVDTDANDKYGAFAVGAHDDLVTAVGLACLEDPGFYAAYTGPRIFP